MAWKSIDTFDDNGTTMCLQQKIGGLSGELKDKHRVIPVKELI